MKTNHVVALAVVIIAMLTSLSVGGVAQAPATPDQMVAALKQNLAESQKNIRKYEWVETTTISLKGEEKSRKQQRVYYGADGTLTKLPIGEPPPQAAQQQELVRVNVRHRLVPRANCYRGITGVLPD